MDEDDIRRFEEYSRRKFWEHFGNAFFSGIMIAIIVCVGYVCAMVAEIIFCSFR